jgi:hypothetical protein
MHARTDAVTRRQRKANQSDFSAGSWKRLISLQNDYIGTKQSRKTWALQEKGSELVDVPG